MYSDWDRPAWCIVLSSELTVSTTLRINKGALTPSLALYVLYTGLSEDVGERPTPGAAPHLDLALEGPEMDFQWFGREWTEFVGLYFRPCWAQFCQRCRACCFMQLPQVAHFFFLERQHFPFSFVSHPWQAGLPRPAALGLCRAHTWARNKAQCVIPAAVTMPPAQPCPPPPQPISCLAQTFHSSLHSCWL